MKKSIKTGLTLALLGCTFLATFSGCNCMGTSDSGSGSSGSVEGMVGEETIVAAAVLRQGSKGGEVKEVQRRLKLWGYYNGSVDGVFGPNTKAAVISFQKKNGLTADGVVGMATYKALGMNSSYNVLANQSNASGSSGTNGYSSSDVYLLAKTIYEYFQGENSL